MKPQSYDSGDDPRDEVLKEWKVDSTLPPRFQEQVWQRIAVQERRTNRGSWQAILYWVEGMMARPALAVSYVAVLFMLGASTGYWHAQWKAEQTVTELQSRYIHAVDPYKASPLMNK